MLLTDSFDYLNELIAYIFVDSVKTLIIELK